MIVSTYDGNAGVIELVVEALTGEAEGDWLFETNGPGIMVAEPKVFGRVYARPETLIPGNCYFSVGFYENDLVLPMIDTLVYVGQEKRLRVLERDDDDSIH